MEVAGKGAKEWYRFPPGGKKEDLTAILVIVYINGTSIRAVQTSVHLAGQVGSGQGDLTRPVIF